jgi:hypothetical protein
LENDVAGEGECELPELPRLPKNPNFGEIARIAKIAKQSKLGGDQLISVHQR